MEIRQIILRSIDVAAVERGTCCSGPRKSLRIRFDMPIACCPDDKCVTS